MCELDYKGMYDLIFFNLLNNCDLINANLKVASLKEQFNEIALFSHQRKFRLEVQIPFFHSL